jgi:hypothetical protein
MLLQTNSYLVPREKRAEHSRLLGRFRQTLSRLGCTHFEAYEQVGSNWSPTESTGRFVQIMRFRDRKHQLSVQAAERNDPAAQSLIREFCDLINFSYQQQQGLFAVGFYAGAIPMTAKATEIGDSSPPGGDDAAPAGLPESGTVDPMSAAPANLTSLTQRQTASPGRIPPRPVPVKPSGQ